jgi:cytochrome c oxidase subunit 2
MQPRFRLLPEQASTFAQQVDALAIFLTAVSGFITLVVFLLVVYFALRYRRRLPDERPAPVKEPHWFENVFAGFLFVVFMVMFFWGARIYFIAFKDAPDALDIHVVGKQWMWKVQHPDGSREINELHVPLGQRVQLTLASQDVIHSFYVPAFRLKQDAVPGRYTKISFEATKAGEYHLFCAEYCGTLHSRMIGRVFVMEPEKYQEWLAGTVADEPPAESGAKLYRQYGCVTCHGAQAPSLAGLFGTEREVVMPSGQRRKVRADEGYLRESILDSTAAVVPGYQPIMPSFRGQLSEEQVLQLVAFIKSLRDARSDPAAGAAGGTRPGQTGETVPDKTPSLPGPAQKTNRD